MRGRLAGRVWAVLSFAGLAGLAVGVHRGAAGSWWSADFAAAAPLLLFNYGMFQVAARMGERARPGGTLVPGLVWILLKVFVNTFTIFLLIGLHAVRSSVFVPVFFITYAGVLTVGILRLNRKSPLEPEQTPDG